MWRAVISRNACWKRREEPVEQHLFYAGKGGSVPFSSPEVGWGMVLSWRQCVDDLYDRWGRKTHSGETWAGPGKGEVPQVLVPKGMIFGSAMEEEGFSLVGCMVSPCFKYEEFELFERKNYWKNIRNTAMWSCVWPVSKHLHSQSSAIKRCILPFCVLY